MQRFLEYWLLFTWRVDLKACPSSSSKILKTSPLVASKGISFLVQVILAWGLENTSQVRLLEWLRRRYSSEFGLAAKNGATGEIKNDFISDYFWFIQSFEMVTNIEYPQTNYSLPFPVNSQQCSCKLRHLSEHPLVLSVSHTQQQSNSPLHFQPPDDRIL